MIYKTLYFKGNPNAEYQYRKGVWYKRAKRSKNPWYPLDTNGQKILQKEYGARPMMFFYNMSFILAAGAVLAIGGWYVYNTVLKKKNVLPKI